MSSFSAAPAHHWDLQNQHPELWHLYNARKGPGELMRVFPLSNWTELDDWQYILRTGIAVVPLYFAALRPVVRRQCALILLDDERLPLHPGELPELRRVRFRSLGRYPLTGAVESDAERVAAIVEELQAAGTSERQGGLIDHDSSGSMELKKQEDYFR